MSTPPTLSHTLDELLTNLVSIFNYLDISEKEVSRSVSKAFASADAPKTRKTSDVLLTLQADAFLSGLISTWSNRPEYVDDRGVPLAIERYGDVPSFETLYDIQAIHNPKGAGDLSVDEAFKRCVDHTVLEVNPAGLCKLTKSHFPSNTRSSVGASVQLNYINDYVSTAYVNFEHARVDGRFQRIANTMGFPKKELPTLNSLLSEHGMEFLRLVDDFIEQHRVNDPSDRDDVVDVGVGVYFYQRSPR